MEGPSLFHAAGDDSTSAPRKSGQKATSDRCVRCITFRRKCDGVKPTCGTCASTPTGVRKCDWPLGRPTRSELLAQMEQERDEGAGEGTGDVSAGTGLVPQKRSASGARPVAKRARTEGGETQLPNEEQTGNEGEDGEDDEGEQIPLPPRARGAIGVPTPDGQSHLAIILGEERTDIRGAVAAHTALEDRFRDRSAQIQSVEPSSPPEDTATRTQFTEDELVPWNPSDLGDLLDGVTYDPEFAFFDFDGYFTQSPDRGPSPIEPTLPFADEDAQNYVKWHRQEESKGQSAADEDDIANSGSRSQTSEFVGHQAESNEHPNLNQTENTAEFTNFIDLT